MSNKKEKKYLENYNIKDYERPSVAADIVIFSILEEDNDDNRKGSEGQLSLLLIRRKEHPFMDSWALPGGFWRQEETMEECALRELSEETGLDKAKIVQIGSFSKPGRDPRGWILSNAYMAPVCRQETMIRGGDDAAEAAWFSVSYSVSKTGICKLSLTSQERKKSVKLSAKLKAKTGITGRTEYEVSSNDGIAFDHAEIIVNAIETLRSHLIVDGLAYSFLPEKFTFFQLQKVHEIVLDQQLLTANFRRKMLPEIEETGEVLDGKAFRPAMLFKRRG